MNSTAVKFYIGNIQFTGKSSFHNNLIYFVLHYGMSHCFGPYMHISPKFCRNYDRFCDFFISYIVKIWSI